jgi:peptidoglycan hydrolase-like protein with peptidoglycan-binding domain
MTSKKATTKAALLRVVQALLHRRAVNARAIATGKGGEQIVSLQQALAVLTGKASGLRVIRVIQL